MRVEPLALHDGTGTAVTPAPAGRGALRLGWDEQGLLLLLELPASRLAATGTVNLTVRDGARPLNWWQAMVDLPAPDAPRLIEHRHDQWVDPRDARPALAALAPLTLVARTATTTTPARSRPGSRGATLVSLRAKGCRSGCRCRLGKAARRWRGSSSAGPRNAPPTRMR